MHQQTKLMLIEKATDAVNQLIPRLHKVWKNEVINPNPNLYPSITVEGVDYTLSMTDYRAIHKIIDALNNLKED